MPTSAISHPIGGALPFPTLLIIPSGIGCAIGGFAGDAIPAARLLAAASDCLITHPNVMNGASLYWSDPRIYYVEGYGLDRFAAGQIALKPVRQQRIGLILDLAIEPQLMRRQLQVADGCRATLGLNIGPVITTDSPLGVDLIEGPSGASWGRLARPDSLLRAGERLQNAGATAIAVVTRFPDDSNNDTLKSYRHGNGVDALAGAEAVISHLLVRHLGIPCAHAPALEPLSIDDQLDPRAAGEELGYTFLACVLLGLSRAPDMTPLNPYTENGFILEEIITVDQIGAVIAPEGALGGEAVLACIERGLPLITVANPGVLNVSLEALGIKKEQKELRRGKFVCAKNFPEAAGWLMMLREGISWESVQRPLNNLSFLD